jgi:ketosteroid isomerase-like protein
MAVQLWAASRNAVTTAVWRPRAKEGAKVVTTQIPQFLADLEERFNAAMVSNDVERIAECITEDWLLITPEAGPVSRARILDVVGSGRLTHSSMTKVATHAAVVGDMAWVTGRGQNTGTFNGAPIQADEYITDIYRRVGDTWLCMLTHLTPAHGAAS